MDKIIDALQGLNTTCMSGTSLLILLILTYFGAPLWMISGAILGSLFVFGVSFLVIKAIAVVLIILTVSPIRKYILSYPLFKLINKLNILIYLWINFFSPIDNRLN